MLRLNVDEGNSGSGIISLDETGEERFCLRRCYGRRFEQTRWGNVKITNEADNTLHAIIGPGIYFFTEDAIQNEDGTPIYPRQFFRGRLALGIKLIDELQGFRFVQCYIYVKAEVWIFHSSKLRRHAPLTFDHCELEYSSRFYSNPALRKRFDEHRVIIRFNCYTIPNKECQDFL